MLAHSVRANGLATVRLWLDLASVPASLCETASAGSVRGTIDPSTRQTSSPSDAPLSRPSRCAPMPFIVSHHRAQISPCPEPAAPAASCDATLPPRTALASDPNASCRFDPRCASRYEPSRHELALVSSGRGPYAESGFAQEPALAAPPIFSFEIGSSTALSSRSSPVRAPSRLDRARAPRGTRAAAIPVRSTDICNPQDLFSTTSPTVSVCSESCSHATREPPVQRRQPASAVRALPFSSLRSAALPPRYAARRTSDVLGCSHRERSGRAPRSHVARAPSRAPSRRVNGRAGRFDSGRLPLFSCLSPRPTNRPERVALDRSSRTIARATR